MLTWINENAKWVVAIFAVMIALGLLAMDRTPQQSRQYPIGTVNGVDLAYGEYNTAVNRVVEANRDKQLSDEDRAKIRNEVFNVLVRQQLLKEQYQANALYASVAEKKAILKNNPEAVRRVLVEEANQRVYMLQQNAANEQEFAQSYNAFLQTLPKFLLDSTFDKAAYDAWLETPEAYDWASMQNYEQTLEKETIPQRQLQLFVIANMHPTSLESEWVANNRLSTKELEVAYVSGSDFKVDPASVDSAKVSAYFNANPDSFFVKNDEVRLEYAFLPLNPTQKDEDDVKAYAETVYNQITDSTATLTFEDAAKTSSEDLATAPEGGVLGDFTPRGKWVKEFEEAAFALDSGAISKPVRTVYGYHIIQCLGKSKDSTGAEMVKVAHILFKVTASRGTVDSLEKVLLGIKTAVENSDSSFADAAKARGVPTRESEWIGHDQDIAELGFVGGLSAYAFVNKERPDLAEGKVSGALKNNNWTLVATRIDSLKAGKRNVSPFAAQIKNSVAQQEQQAAAVEYLKSVEAQVKAVNLVSDSANQNPVDSSIAKVTVEKANASYDGYVAGIGAANPTLFAILSKQKEGEWGEPVATNDGAVMVKIISSVTPDSAELAKAAAEDQEYAQRYFAEMYVQNYVTNLENTAKIESNIDLYYRE